MVFCTRPVPPRRMDTMAGETAMVDVPCAPAGIQEFRSLPSPYPADQLPPDAWINPLTRQSHRSQL
jgi:hypothetical protein